MEQILSIQTLIRGRAHVIAAYMVTIYYLEIILLMFALLFLYGKTVSIISGVVLSLALAYHIIQLYVKKNLHRKIQLYIIDIHAAFAAGYCLYNAAAGIGTNGLSLVIFSARAFILVCELVLLFLLTGSSVAETFTA